MIAAVHHAMHAGAYMGRDIGTVGPVAHWCKRYLPDLLVDDSTPTIPLGLVYRQRIIADCTPLTIAFWTNSVVLPSAKIWTSVRLSM